MDALLVRAAAAHELVDAGLIDGLLALSYVIFPTEEVEAASTVRAGLRSRWTEDHKLLAFELADAGLTQREIAIRVCGSADRRTTVQGWLRDRTVV